MDGVRLSFRFRRESDRHLRLIARVVNQTGRVVGGLKCCLLDEQAKVRIENISALGEPDQQELIKSEILRRFERRMRDTFQRERVIATVISRDIGFYLSNDYHVSDVIHERLSTVFVLQKYLWHAVAA